MNKVYVISDCHFGHRNICKFRPQFSSVEEHNEYLFERIMACAGKRSSLWMLGDMFFDSEVLTKYGEPIRKNFGYTNIVLGNHDTDNTDRAENVGHMWCMFNAVHGMHSKYGFWLSHAPIHPAELRGKRNIHGHVHSESIRKEDGSIDERYFNACCENIDYKPILLQDIRDGYMGKIT